jgi:hypothetical protein
METNPELSRVKSGRMVAVVTSVGALITAATNATRIHPLALFVSYTYVNQLCLKSSVHGQRAGENSPRKAYTFL